MFNNKVNEIRNLLIIVENKLNSKKVTREDKEFLRNQV